MTTPAQQEMIDATIDFVLARLTKQTRSFETIGRRALVWKLQRDGARNLHLANALNVTESRASQLSADAQADTIDFKNLHSGGLVVPRTE